jgi:hypothetical protein
MRTLFTFGFASLLLFGCAPGSEPPYEVDSGEFSLDGALLPDLVVREADLYDNAVDYADPLHPMLRLSNGTANVGDGQLYLYGGTANADGTQDVVQRVFSSTAAFEDRLAGKFIFHPGHSHIHFEGWASYRLRAIEAGDGVGAIVAEGEKTSFCIVDLGVYSSSVPNFDPDGFFHSCSSTTQGLSVGWIDVYSRYLSGQSIDIAFVPAGRYWLESVVDPDNLVLEKDETNNVTRIKVTIGTVPLAPDAFEPNETAAAVDARPAGGPNSPNLGPAGPERTITGLTVDDASDVDWFRFYANDTGAPGDSVRIAFAAADGDLDLSLHDAAGQLLDTSAASGTDSEELSLEGLPEGWYFAKVVGKGGTTHPSYSLTVNPPANQPPAVSVLAPASGDVELIHSVDTYTIQFGASDPEGDETWVSLYVNDAPVLDGSETLLPTSLHTPGAQGFYVLNSADVPPGTYWIYAAVTDGGVTSGAWSAGTVTFIVDPNCAHDLCSTGVALTTTCDPCATKVCAADPYCCGTAWDSICVGEIATVCGGSCTDASSCGIDHVVVNEVRTRGVAGGNDDFIELYNPTSLSVVLDDTWKLDTRAHNGASYVSKWIGDGGFIPPGGYYLVANALYTQTVADDQLSSGITDAGSIRLRQDGATVDAVCMQFSSSTLTALGGAGFECEGTPESNLPHNNLTSGGSNSDVSLERNTCADTQNNAADFAQRTPATPKSSAHP